MNRTFKNINFKKLPKRQNHCWLQRSNYRFAVWKHNLSHIRVTEALNRPQKGLNIVLNDKFSQIYIIVSILYECRLQAKLSISCNIKVMIKKILIGVNLREHFPKFKWNQILDWDWSQQTHFGNIRANKYNLYCQFDAFYLIENMLNCFW